MLVYQSVDITYANNSITFRSILDVLFLATGWLQTGHPSPSIKNDE